MKMAHSVTRLMETIPCFALDTAGRVTAWNAACSALTGIRPSDILGTDRHWLPFYRQQKPLLADRLLAEALEPASGIRQEGHPRVSASGLKHIDYVLGGSSLVWTQAFLRETADDAIAGAIQIFQTVSFCDVLDCSPFARVFIDKFPLPVAMVINERIHAVNAAYAELTGFGSPTELEGMHVAEFIDSSDKQRFMDLNRDHHAGLQSGKIYRWNYSVRGECRKVEGHPTIFRLGNDTILISAVVDVTDAVRRQEELARDKRRLAAQNRRLLAEKAGLSQLHVGASPVMDKVLARAQRLAATEVNIVILGETGTGKSMLARLIHEMSARKDAPFVAINCAAIPEQLLESEFFGHVRGAFTGATSEKQGYLATANGGTLFLDEVGELRPDMQAKLLHAVERKKYTPVGGGTPRDSDVRLICATNRNLEEMLGDGSLREDFFYRIFVGDICIPPLRERREDLAGLIRFFWKKFSDPVNRKELPAQMMRALMAYDWPGNVRELQNVILRFLAIGELNFQPGVFRPKAREKEGGPGVMPMPAVAPGFRASFPENGTETLARAVTRAERECIVAALLRSNGRKDRAAVLLGVNIRTFHRKCAKYGL